MYMPPHPGEHLLEDCIKPLGLTVTSAAAVLGVSRKTLSAVVNGNAGISADMAVRIAKTFGSTPDFWIRLQGNYDLSRARERMKDWKPKQSFIDRNITTN